MEQPGIRFIHKKQKSNIHGSYINRLRNPTILKRKKIKRFLSYDTFLGSNN